MRSSLLIFSHRVIDKRLGGSAPPSCSFSACGRPGYLEQRSGGAGFTIWEQFAVTL